MAKNKLNLNLGELEQPQAPATPVKPQPTKKKSKPAKAKVSFGKRIMKVIREIISELKKVDWPPFKRTKNNPGVLANLGTVLVVVAFFLVIITAFDSGLAALLKLLNKGA